MKTLYPFQQEALDKLVQVKDCLNGDEMGLGKTVQGIVLDKAKRALYGAEFNKKGKALTLVIGPLAVLDAWREHFQEWQPALKVEVIDPKNRQPFVASFLKGAADVYICHWESLRLIPELKKILWFHIIADEVHRIKNRKAQMTHALKGLHAEHKLGLSGTAADNKPEDFWSVLNWLFPKWYGSYWRFVNYHVIQKYHTAGTCTANDCFVYHKRAFRETIGVAHANEIHERIKNNYVRRLKEDVLKDLPEKYKTEIWVKLHPQQRRAYEAMRTDMLAWVGKHETEPLAAPWVISQLVRLQQFACAYGELITVRRKYKKCGFEQCLVDAANEVYNCEGHDVEQLRLTEPSSKVDAVAELIGDNDDRAFVVFGQSKQVAGLLHERLRSKGITSALYTGDTPAADRDVIVRDFQAGKIKVFIGTIKAGGVGLTLTRASTVVFFDRAWSPAANRQAEDRLHRIGQKNAVQIIDVIAHDTIDTKRLEQIQQKWEWLKEILGDTK